MKKKNNDNNVLGKVALGAAVIGAGALAAKVLSDEDNRKKIGNAISDAGEKGKEIITNVKERFADSIEALRAEYDSLVETIEERLSDAQGRGEKILKEIQVRAKKVGKEFDEFKDDASEKGSAGIEKLKVKVSEIREELSDAIAE